MVLSFLYTIFPLYNLPSIRTSLYIFTITICHFCPGGNYREAKELPVCICGRTRPRLLPPRSGAALRMPDSSLHTPWTYARFVIVYTPRGYVQTREVSFSSYVFNNDSWDAFSTQQCVQMQYVFSLFLVNNIYSAQHQYAIRYCRSIRSVLLF